jgi:hypothetical protein
MTILAISLWSLKIGCGSIEKLDRLDPKGELLRLVWFVSLEKIYREGKLSTDL